MCQRKKTQQILTLSFYDLCLIVERDNKKKGGRDKERGIAGRAI